MVVGGVSPGSNGQIGVFCLEGDWESDLRRPTPSVRALLELMDASGQVKAVYRDVGTEGELEHYARIWLDQRRYDGYRLGWLAFHGAPGLIRVGRRALSLEQLADVFGKGSCVGKMLYLGSCGTIGVEPDRLARFRQQIGASVVCGYTESVDWMEAAAFELLLLQTLGDYQRSHAALRRLRADYGGLADRLGFRSDPTWT
jgi:hypothetical protein